MKRILSYKDLAVNGAPPAYNDTIHVGRPNIGNRDQYLLMVSSLLDRRWLSNDGPLVQEFESKIARYLGVDHVVAMCNATIALEIAIRALNLTGEIIVPSYTFVATAHAVHWQGLTPVFADIDVNTHCIDVDSVKRLITPRTSGVIGVHLWGRPVAVKELEGLCRERGIALMFDAAHSFGVSLGGTMIGNFGRCEVFSFHATKFLNSHEGGAIATNDGALAERMRLMRNFGFKGFDNVIHPGTNGKMVEVCAAMGIINLESIGDVIAVNRRNHRAYAEGLAGIAGLRLLGYDDSEKNNWQYVVVEVGELFPVSRDEVVAALHAENVLARKYFWPGVHRMAPYRDLFPWADALLPATNQVARSVIVLPTGTAVTVEDVDTICSVFRVLAKSG